MRNRAKLLVTSACVLVIGSLVWGFIVVGSPMRARAKKFDERRVGDLQSIQWQIISYWQQKAEIPENLDKLKDPISNFYLPMDPETRQSYGYKPTSDLSFQLCADFGLANSRDAIDANVKNGTAVKPIGYGLDSNEQNWNHGAGRTCFDRVIDPDRYPPNQPTRQKPL